MSVQDSAQTASTEQDSQFVVIEYHESSGPEHGHVALTGAKEDCKIACSHREKTFNIGYTVKPKSFAEIHNLLRGRKAGSPEYTKQIADRLK